ncbi:MAG TPA: DUF6518 family protein [Gaiellaceae bacterium]|nr:DUF6518 family protein [Gaiellaceae bacterium]
MSRRAVVVTALAASAVFGAADQYLGSFSAHPWAADVSLLSAPWLVLAFLAGWTQGGPRRGALVGLACTFAALVGYCVLTLSPVEHAQLTGAGVEGFVRSSRRVIVGGLFTGPLFGWLGHRWRTGRAWPGAVLVAGAVCLEPLARLYAGTGYEIRFSTVWLAEVAAGLAMLGYVAWATIARRRWSGPADPSPPGRIPEAR